MRPKLNIALMNGGLGLLGPAAFGTCGLLIASPSAPVAGYGVPFLCKSKKAVTDAFAQVGNSGIVTAINTYFFGEASEGTSLYIMCMARTTTLATMLAAVNADKLLTLANGAIRMLGVIKYPDTGTYTPTIATGFDNDVHAAATAAQTLCNAWFGNKKPFRCLIEGYGFTTAGDALDYSTVAHNYRNVGIVAANIGDSTANALLIVLGRAAKVNPNQNIGRIKSKSLNIEQATSIKIGATAIENVAVADLDLLHDKRYISFERNEVESGVVITDDNMLTQTTDDYNNLAYGRVIDNATRITFNTYYRELKDDVEVDEGGRLAPVVEKALEDAIEADMDKNMRGQLSKKKDGISDVTALVNPDPTVYAPLYAANGITNPNFNILQTGQVYLFLQLRPKGCMKYLYIYLGYTS